MNKRIFLPPEAPRLGEYAETTYGQRGRVCDVHHTLGEVTGIGSGNMRTEWLDANSITEAEQRESWLGMLVDGGGSVVLPASRFTRIEPFDFSNDYAAEYFRDALVGDEVVIDRSAFPI